MKILINYDVMEKPLMSLLSYILKQYGIEGIATSKEYTPAELIKVASTAQCKGILLINEASLRKFVQNPKATLDGYRGSHFPLPIPTVVLNKIAHINTVPHGKFLIGRDISKLVRIVSGSSTPAPKFSFTVLSSSFKMMEAFEVISSSLMMSYDIETSTFLENEEAMIAGETLITCAGWSCLSKDGTIHTYVLPFINFGEDYWRKEGEYEEALSYFRKINALDIPKVMHNGMYDCTHSIAYRAVPRNFCIDTMALAHSEYAELPKTLDFVSSLHLDDYVQWKDESEAASKNKDIQRYWAYNAKDCWNTLRLAITMLRTMPQYAKVNYANKFKLVYPALYCAFEGFKIDIEVQDNQRVNAQAELDEARRLLRVYVADDNFNPGSWKQVEKYIYRVFGAKKPNAGKSKSCTDEKNLMLVGDQHPLLALLTDSIISYRGNQKAIGTYFNFLKKNHRLLWALNPFGTETERMSCNSSSFWCGTQVQNIPKYAKDFLVADEWHELIEVDNSQSEGRCTAYLSQDLNLIKAIESKTHDFYKTLGTLFFGMPYEEVTDFFRNKVLKKIVHGTNYRMGAKTFEENIGLKVLHTAASILGFKLVPSPKKKNPRELTVRDFCKSLLEKYHAPFNRIRMWYDEIKYEIATTGKLVSPLGHTRIFFGDISKDHNMLTSAVAHQPQNLSVHILNIGLWKVYKELVLAEATDLPEGFTLGSFRLKAQVHDSILAQYLIIYREYVRRKMTELMSNPVEIHGRTLLIPVDAKTGNDWKHMK